LSQQFRPSADYAQHDPAIAASGLPMGLPTSASAESLARPASDESAREVQEPAATASLPVPPPALLPIERHASCTTAQLRRFIKSRAYVPMHEIRRRFLIATEDDDVARIDLGDDRIFVGLPEREGQMLGELLRGGEIGFELQLDPVAPVVVGVYPMRPVTRG
jgi:hypothetical protein